MIKEIIEGKIKKGENVQIKGWVRNKRSSKIGIYFLSIYDGSCFNSLQVIAGNKLKNYKSEISILTTGCSVKVVGTIQKSLGSKQKFDLFSEDIKVFGFVKNPEKYPISPKNHSFEYLRKVSHLRSRTNFIGAVMRIRNTLFQEIHNFLCKDGYIWISSPIITTLNAEGAGKMFRVSTLNLLNITKNDYKKINFSKDFFGQESFLTVSGQLNNESYACSLGKVYSFGPAFRAENSNTSRHLSEFWMVEPEAAFLNLEEIIHTSERMLKHLFNSVLEKREDDLKFFYEKVDKKIISRLEKFVYSNFVHVEYTEVVKILKRCDQNLFNTKITWGMELSVEHERYLTENYFMSPIIVKNHPKEIKAFYMRLNEDNKTVASMDVLFPKVGELIGGSQREERLNELDKRLSITGLSKKEYSWYRDLRKYGTVPHSGFGLGFDRLVICSTGIKNIRESIPFPRTPSNAKF
ncbi:asparagine--tRNA ligase [Candidatus Riesia sp. GBBU]|nr:asparagine--tRNA ligase [Candidatus Riesia sp. GBBU]